MKSLCNNLNLGDLQEVSTYTATETTDLFLGAKGTSANRLYLFPPEYSRGYDFNFPKTAHVFCVDNEGGKFGLIEVKQMAGRSSRNCLR